MDAISVPNDWIDAPNRSLKFKMDAPPTTKGTAMFQKTAAFIFPSYKGPTTAVKVANH